MESVPTILKTAEHASCSLLVDVTQLEIKMLRENLLLESARISGAAK